MGARGQGMGAGGNCPMMTSGDDVTTCTGDDCWFKIKYNYPAGAVHDSTTWAAYIEGNPIRLIK